MYHVNSSSEEGIEKSFERFLIDVMEDQTKNNRKDDFADDLWDESFKVKARP